MGQLVCQPMSADSHRRDLGRLPKAHLHIHLEGAMRRSTLDELADLYGIERPPDTRGQRFDDFMGFNATYWAACHCIRTPEDLARLITEVTEDAAEHGAWWHEPAFDPARYSTERAGGPHQMFETQEDCWHFSFEVAEAVEQETGVGTAFVAAADRTQPVERAVERAEIVKRLASSRRHMINSGMECFDGRHAAIASFGLHSNEEGHPPEPFAEAFRVATDGTGLLSTPHAGEIAPFPGGGPASVEGAVEVLGADRIQHGVLSIEDPALVARLASDQVCLDVCPSSNLLLKVFGSVREHPLPALLEAGVPCSLASDDPLLFGPSLLDEYELCRHRMGLGDEQLAAIARASFEFSAAPRPVKDAGIAAIEGWLSSGG